MMNKNLNLKEELLYMIAIINPNDIGLLRAQQEAIINTQSEYYENKYKD